MPSEFKFKEAYCYACRKVTSPRLACRSKYKGKKEEPKQPGKDHKCCMQ